MVPGNTKPVNFYYQGRSFVENDPLLSYIRPDRSPFRKLAVGPEGGSFMGGRIPSDFDEIAQSEKVR
jgi:hypothetical protein